MTVPPPTAARYAGRELASEADWRASNPQTAGIVVMAARTG
jgi:hypothetical protein